MRNSLRILALDVSSSMGWAIFDTERSPSSIHCDAISLTSNDGDTGAERRRLMRQEIDEVVCRLISQQRPDIACIESPLNFLGETGGGGAKKIRGQRGLPLHTNLPAAPEDKKRGGPNANTAFMLNQIFAVADTVCRHKCPLGVIEVAPRTWQALTKSMPGEDTKARSIAFCKQLQITLPSSKKGMSDAADAAVISLWAQGKSQELKLLARAQGELI